MEYVLWGKDEGGDHGTLSVHDSRFTEDEVTFTIEYKPSPNDPAHHELMILVRRGDLLAMAAGVIGSPEKTIPPEEMDY